MVDKKNQPGRARFPRVKKRRGGGKKNHMRTFDCDRIAEEFLRVRHGGQLHARRVHGKVARRRGRGRGRGRVRGLVAAGCRVPLAQVRRVTLDRLYVLGALLGALLVRPRAFVARQSVGN